jgi:hypothetical protein
MELGQENSRYWPQKAAVFTKMPHLLNAVDGLSIDGFGGIESIMGCKNCVGAF